MLKALSLSKSHAFSLNAFLISKTHIVAQKPHTLVIYALSTVVYLLHYTTYLS